MFWHWFKKHQQPETTENTVPVVLIHGANQTSKSFVYIKQQLPNWRFVDVDYDSHESFDNNLKRMTSQLKHLGPVFIVGHSLGGVYAAHLTQYINVVGAVTLASPYGGSGMADWARYLVPGFQLLKDIGRRSKPIVELQNIQITVPWLQVVGTRGNVPWMPEPNDGVLTLESVRAMPGIEYVELPVNHYEIVCDDNVVDIIISQYYNITNE